MVRRVSLVLAIIAGIAAAVLASTSPRVQVADRSASCTAFLVVFEDSENETRPSGPSELERACDAEVRERGWLTGLAVLVCLIAGSGARFAGRGDDDSAVPEPVRFDARQS